MNLRFTKMHGAGNDFVIIDMVRQSATLSPNQIRRIANRQRGIGCDQVLLVEAPDQPDADFRYRIFNPDGSEAGQCGNGARCFARFVKEQNLSWKRELRVLAPGGPMTIKTDEDGLITANLGCPVFSPEHIPMTAEHEQIEYTLLLGGKEVRFGAISMGNPHAIIRVDNVKTAPVAELGAAMQADPNFPDRVNVGFMEIVNSGEIRLRVFERGAGETQACGSGACAAVVHGIRMGELDNKVTVYLPGGKLKVSWMENNAPVWLGGPTATIFEGSIRLRNR